MSIFGGSKKIKKVFIGNTKIKSIYLGADKIWSGASVVTYNVDVNTSYTEEIDEGNSVLTPQSFVPTKSGYTFLGWKDSGIASSNVIEEKVADGNPITLFAVFTKTITVTYRNYTVTSTATGTQYYNNSDTLNPSFTLTQTPISAWTARGWTTSTSGGASAITYANGATFTRDSNITLYGCYYRTVTVYYNGNGATSGSTAASTGTAYYHSASGGTNAAITIRANGFARTNYGFRYWRLNSTSGTAYSAGSTYTSVSDAQMYAEWIYTGAYTFNYTGGMQSFTAQAGVTYQIQLYGAQGGSVNGIAGGNGGYTIGYRTPSSNEIWYIGVGGQGAAFNGGGVTNRGGNGGGASHISLQNAQIASSSLGNIIGIAGGGGGCGGDWSTVEPGKPWYGGTGGGTNGGNGTYQTNGTGHYSGFGGSQTAGGSGAYTTTAPDSKGNSGSYGQGGNGRTVDAGGVLYGGGGGGGLYGGGGGHYMNGIQAGGGGSGSIRALASAGMSNGQKTGNGQVIIKVHSS